MELSRMTRIAILIAAAALLAAGLAPAQQPIEIAQLTRQEPVDFDREILPILRASCLACHSAAERQGDLVLESPAAMLNGGDSGPAIVPGKGGESLLLKLASGRDEPLMPPPDNDVAAKALTPQQLGLIKLWIDQGAKGSGLGTVLSPASWRPLPPGNHPIYAVAVTPDGQFAACSRANQIFIYHVPTGQLVTKLNDPALQEASKDKLPGIADLDVIQSLAYSKQGDVLASGGFRTVKLWRYPRDVRRLALDAAPAASDAVTAVAASPDRALLATAAADHVIKLWNAETGEAVRSLAGHTGAVVGLKFSHNGSRLYSASADRTIRAWSVADGAIVGRIDSPTEVAALEVLSQKVLLPAPQAPAPEAKQPASEPAEGAAAEPAAQQFEIVEQLATGGGDNFVRLWKAPHALAQPLANPPPKANVLAVSPDGKLLALANAEGTVSVLSPGEDKPIHTWAAHAGPIEALAFRPPPPPQAAAEAAEAAAPIPQISELATGGADGTVRLWKFASGQPAGVLRGTLAAVTGLAFTPDGKLLVAGMADGQATVWNLEAPAPRWLSESGAPATLAVVSPDGKLLAVATTAGEQPAIVVRQMPGGKVFRTLFGHTAPVRSLAFSSDGTKIASGSADRSARVWSLADEKFPEAAQLSGHGGAVTAVAFNADGQQVLSGADDGSLKLWSVAEQKELRSLAGHTGAIVAVAVTPQNQLVSAAADKTIRIWNPLDGQAVRTITDPAALTAMALSRDGARIAAAGDDRNIRIYQLGDAALVATLGGHQAAAVSLSFSSDNARLVSGAGDNDHRVIIWNAADGRLLEILPVEKGLSAAAWGAGPAEVVLADAAGGVQQAALRFALALGGMKDKITGLAVRSDGQMIYTACADGTVRGFNPANGQQAFAANHGAAVHHLALSPDGQRLASAGEDKLIKLWNPANGAPLNPPQLAGFAAPVRAAAFTPDNARVIGGSAGGEVLVFDAAGELEESVVGHAGAIAAVAALANVSEGASSAVSLSADGTALAWQPQALGRLAGHSQPVTSLASFPAVQGQPPQLVSGGLDGILQRWNLATRQSVGQLNHGGPVTGVAVRPDSQRIASTSSNNTVRLWNAANNALVLEMRGDLRADALAVRLNQEKGATMAKVAALKAELAAAEQDLPTKMQAAATAAAALAAARTDVEGKAAALAQASSAKSAAEQRAIEMAAGALAMARKMEEANQLALALAAEAKLLADKANLAQSAAQSQPENQTLAQAYAAAMQTAAAADAKAKAAEAAKAAPQQAAEAAAKTAADAATAALAMAKPFTDASAALAAAQQVLQAAQQADAIASRELKLASDRVPAAKDAVAKAEAALGKIDADLAAATAAAAAAQKPVAAVAFSPDGRTLATAGEFPVVHTWDGETGKAVASYVGHAGPLRAIAYVGSDELISGGADKQAIVWGLNPQWRLERVIGRIDDPATIVDRVMGLDFSPDGKLLAVCGGVPSRSGEVKIFGTADGALVRNFEDAHADQVNGVAFSSDGEYLATASADKYVKKFSLASGQQLVQFEGHTGHVLSVAWRADGAQLASAGADASINTWNAASGDRIVKIEGYARQLTAVRYVGQSPFIVSTSGDGIVRMHNAENGGVQRSFPAPADYMYAIDVTPNPDAGVVVAGGHDGVLRIWNTANAQPLHELAAPSEPAESASAKAP